MPPEPGITGPSQATQAASPRRPWGGWATSGWVLLIIGLGFLVGALVYAATGRVVALINLARYGEEAPVTIIANWMMEDLINLHFPALIASQLCFLVPALILCHRRMSVRNYLALTAVPRAPLLAWAGAALLLTLVLPSLLDPVFGWEYFTMMETYILRAGGAEWLLLLLTIGLLAPLAEEVLFRGFMMRGLLASRCGSIGAVLLPALLWGVLHYDPDGTLGYPAGPLLAYVGSFGILLGLARIHTGSLYAPLAMHACCNLAALAQAYLLR